MYNVCFSYYSYLVCFSPSSGVYFYQIIQTIDLISLWSFILVSPPKLFQCLPLLVPIHIGYGIWVFILRQSHMTVFITFCWNMMFIAKCSLVTGDELSGKSTLVRKVFSAKSWSSGSSLMYGVEATRDLHGNKGAVQPYCYNLHVSLFASAASY